MRKPVYLLLSVALSTGLLFASGCGDSNDSEATPSPSEENNGNNVQPDPMPGTSDFVSADGFNGQRSTSNEDNNAEGNNNSPDDASADGGDERTVEEGDIYRVLSNDKILNLNSFRGLQVIDASNITAPQVEGRAELSGYPVEMYVAGDYAYVLLNNWQSYYRSIHDTRPESYSGGVLMTVDLSDTTNPRIVDSARIPGQIRTSRLTRQGDQVALYTVANHWDSYINEEGEEAHGSFTYVRSFSLNGGAIDERSEINLGGYIGDIQATPEALLVSRLNRNRNDRKSTVSVIDISNPNGDMIEGSEVEVSGYVSNKYNMDLYKGVLRVVSGATWGENRTNHVQTYDASDIQNLVEIDHDTFGDGENLFATLFLDNKAFFVTYLRVDPFHAYEISDDGMITPHAEYIISGWNNYFRPVENDERLIGIGINDEGNRTLAVSLYDITDISNPDPFIARKEVDANHAWSEANWDDRAFSVLENAVEVEGPNGVTETGLVLLPFSGWDSENNTYQASVQIFTFSRDTLTQRGVMNHHTPVRRSFLANDETTANLSEVEMSFFDHTDPNNPVEQGRVELAPNYTDFLLFGNYGLRIKNSQDYYGWWGHHRDRPTEDTLDIVPLNEHPDLAEPVASIEVPTNSKIVQIGDRLVSISTRYNDQAQGDSDRYTTSVQTWNLSNPISPQFEGELTTNQISPFYDYYGWDYYDCWDCGYGGYSRPSAYSVGESLIFPQSTSHSEVVGSQEICTYRPNNEAHNNHCWDRDADRPTEEPCSFFQGYKRCTSVDGGPTHCSGYYQRCTYATVQYGEEEHEVEYYHECENIEESEVEVELEETCRTRDLTRRWQTYSFQIVDLRDVNQPRLQDPVDMEDDQESVSFLTEGSDLYVTYRQPAEIENDGRPYVRYFFQKFGLDNPASPVEGPSVNIPGQLIAVQGDKIFTQDYIWGDEVVEVAYNRLSVNGDRAILEARRRFVDQEISNVQLDDQGNLLVGHRLSWQAYERDHGNDYNGYHEDQTQRLSVLDADSENLVILSEVPVDLWAHLRDAKGGHALFEVPGGLLLMDLGDGSAPEAQAYFPVRGWPINIHLYEEDIYFAGGRYGMYRFPLDVNNLQ